MNRLSVPLALLVVGVLASAALAEKVKVKPVKEWKCSVADVKLKKDAPSVITSQKELEKVWKSWKVEGKAPAVDFEKEIVVVTTGDGSKLSLSLTLDDKGNLQVLALATRDLAEGFRYVIATVSRKGVKSVDGKTLPK
jgi:hypothetical protein